MSEYAEPEPKKQTVAELFQEIDVREAARRVVEREDARQRRIDLTAARLFATGSTAAEAYAAADILEEAREAFITGRKENP